jgi:cyclomaltodextrinase
MKHLLAICMLWILQWELHAQSLGSVFQLQSGQTQLVKADYLPFENKSTGIQLPAGLSLVNETPEVFTLSGHLSQPMGNIRLITETDTFDIPCRKSRKFGETARLELAKPATKLGIKGSFNQWTIDESRLKPVGKVPTKNWLLETIEANEGYQQYKLVADGEEVDPVNAKLVSNGMGGTNALLKFGEPEGVAPRAFTSIITGNGFRIKVENGNSCLVYWNNKLVNRLAVPKSGMVDIVFPATITHSKGRSFIRVFVCNNQKAGNDLLIPLENGHIVQSAKELTRTDHHTQIMYFMMVDRFANGDPLNDPEPLDSVLAKAQYRGGDLKGIEQKIGEGFFEQLGVNTIWLSPISQNPQGAWGLWNKKVTTKFSAYHGYWPTSYSKVDTRFGSNDLFTEVITAAHQKNTNIILDFVAHHVHTDHPLYKLHPDWVTPLYLPDGSMNTERWDDHRLTTWFDTFLPTLNFENENVRELVADSILFWVKNYELDGFRHDASKHVPEEFWRLLTQKIRIEKSKKTDPSFYQIGETYGSSELIGSYVNSGEMDAQFDFNLYDASVGAFILNVTADTKNNNWEGLQRTLNESFDYYGWHHLMGNISGNQDRPRFASLADGSVKGDEDTKLAGWTRDIRNVNEKGFDRMAQIMALNMTLPGVPVIYYGDEYAMPGGNDPDNRRMMQFDHYTGEQLDLIHKVKSLTSLRKSDMALLYGEYQSIETDKAFFAYSRNYFGHKVMVVFSKNAGTVLLPKPLKENYESLFHQSTSILGNQLRVEMKTDDVAIFIMN